MNSSTKTLIVGGGIGGLTTAVALKRLGFDVTVFEDAPEFAAVGYGILLGANAIKTLGALGLAGKVREYGAKATVGNLYSSSGEILTNVSAEELRRRVGEDSYAIHRSDLQRILLDALGRENVATGVRCSGFVRSEDSVTVRFEDGTEQTGNVLVGADGVHSVVRRQLFGPTKLRYAGYTAWRGLAHLSAEESESVGNVLFETWGRGTRFGFARLDSPDSDRNRVYWFATRNAPEGQRDTNAKDRLTEMLRGWHRPVEMLVAATREDDIRRDDIYDAKPLHTWSRLGVTLVGDAAHPMTPNLGQGACQAIEDAFALGISLRGAKDVQHALMDYEFRRVQRTRTIVNISRYLGKVGQLESPVLCGVRDLGMGLLPDALKLRQFEKVLGSA